MKLLITGGAGFIGVNTALHFLNRASSITIFDNFFRPTSSVNAQFLKKKSSKIKIVEGDVRDEKKIADEVKQADAIIHLAGQVAVTTSLTDPATDFSINVLGSFNVLESARKYNPHATLLYSSTNKVYGDLSKVDIDKHTGIDENTPIDLYSPYGCSKGSADLYFLDYARSFGMNTIVFRQSCIYGPHQYGVEDQGWLAFFALQFLRHKPITVYGTGEQVRDLLFVEDLAEGYEKALQQGPKIAGQVFNFGGGPQNSVSINEAINHLAQIFGYTVPLTYDKKRLGDQDYFVADTRKAERTLGWKAKTGYQSGLKTMIDWCKQH
ncbi:MAG: GDP-mannose 4,6-dehydratase [Patescibacteria group bacterium]|jgi:CDP-paratose 2-epimerase